MRSTPTTSLGSDGSARLASSDWAWLAGLVVAVGLCFAYVYDCFDPATWSNPIGYARDGLYTLSLSKLYAQGEFLPFWSKTASALNAPAVAHWADYPTTEELVFTLTGWLARVFGLHVGANLSLLVAHVLAGISFFWMSRTLGSRQAFAFAGGLAFATCHFVLRHSVDHLMLAHCWHIPLLVAISFRVLSDRGLPAGSGGYWASLAVAAMTGAMNPYFSAMFLQFLALAVLIWCVRGKPARARVPLQLMLCVAFGFVIANADTFAFAWTHGPNSAVVDRSLHGLQHGALEPVTLFLAHAHRLEALTLPNSMQSSRLGDGAAYLGLMGIIGFAVLVGVCLRRVANRDEAGVPPHAWLVLWVLAFSIVGGINAMLGVAGFQLLRATDRYAVVILVLVLFFLVEWLTSVCPRRWVLPVAMALVALVVWDQVLPDPALAETTQRNRRRVDSDRALVAEIEASLDLDAMIFQLPVLPFPEGGGVHRMGKYEQLRPFLNARSLRFSFGAQKGRGWEKWQRDLARLPLARMLERLEALGFDGLLIHRAGFEDAAEGLLLELKQLGGRARIESRDGSFVFVRLKPSHEAERAVALPLRGFHPLQISARHESLWSTGRSELVLHSLASTPQRACLAFDLSSPRSRRVEISRDESVFVRADLEGGRPQRFEDACFDLAPGPNPLQLSSVSGPDESRSFRLIDLRVRLERGPPTVLRVP